MANGDSGHSDFGSSSSSNSPEPQEGTTCPALCVIPCHTLWSLDFPFPV